jgi:diacylglycerol O-acyltransferase / trehalose O-mycolyltransferase
MRASKGLIGVLICVLAALGAADGAAAAPRAAVVATHRVAPRELDLTVRSPALGGRAKVRLLTPDGWSRHAKRRWPVLYLLHGCCDTYVSWTRSSDVARIRALRQVLVVMPEAGWIGAYSNWRTGPQWQRFHLQELPQILDGGYRAGPQRAVAGLSMGGLGALLYAARRPHLFRAAASFSGTIHPLGEPDLWMWAFSRDLPDPLAVWGDPKADRDDWRRHDAVSMAPAMRGVALYISSGNGNPGPFDPRDWPVDPLEVVAEHDARAFVRRARALHIPVTTDFYGPGSHTWPYWQRELHRALPFLLRALR